ncbi:MAG: hypothetical protein D6784_16580 [Chloroflexi bacterium]|nr:MAG: hypothetical protein D6784_16580 [Chloroflexota bacterium]
MPPHLLLTILLGTTYGTVFFLWRGDGARELLLYTVSGVVAFAVGQIIANMVGLDLLMIGPLHIVEASLVSWAGLVAVHWLLARQS